MKLSKAPGTTKNAAKLKLDGALEPNYPDEIPLAERNYSPEQKERYLLLGHIANWATIAASLFLLYLTLKVKDISCDFNDIDGSLLQSCDIPEEQKLAIGTLASLLDDCYICDGFCTSLKASAVVNSHMLSFYVDILMTVPLLVLSFTREKELARYGLGDFYLGKTKLLSVAGHGAAHVFLSFIENDSIGDVTPLVIRTILCVCLGFVVTPFFVSNTTFLNVETLLRIVKKDDPTAQKTSVNHLRSLKISLPFLFSSLPLVLLPDSDTSLLPNLVFGGTAFIFFIAGKPEASKDIQYPIIAAVAMAIGAPFVSPGENIGVSFALTFTSAYVFSALCQLFLWKEKADTPKIYALNAWCTTFFTTAVGWALALKCTALKPWGGHALYDLSIPISYLALYFLTKRLVPLKKEELMD